MADTKTDTQAALESARKAYAEAFIAHELALVEQNKEAFGEAGAAQIKDLLEKAKEVAQQNLLSSVALAEASVSVIPETQRKFNISTEVASLVVNSFYTRTQTLRIQYRELCDSGKEEAAEACLQEGSKLLTGYLADSALLPCLLSSALPSAADCQDTKGLQENTSAVIAAAPGRHQKLYEAVAREILKAASESAVFLAARRFLGNDAIASVLAFSAANSDDSIEAAANAFDTAKEAADNRDRVQSTLDLFEALTETSGDDSDAK